MEQGLNLTVSITALISIPLTVWVVVMLVQINRRTRRIERFLKVRAARDKTDYVPDPETLAEAERILALRAQRRSELQDMEHSK